MSERKSRGIESRRVPEAISSKILYDSKGNIIGTVPWFVSPGRFKKIHLTLHVKEKPAQPT